MPAARVGVICVLTTVALFVAGSMVRCNSFVDTRDGQDSEITVAELEGHVSYLAGDHLVGRGPGTTGLDKAADHIAECFANAGLSSFESLGGYHQPFKLEVAQPEAKALVFQCYNIVGYLPGTTRESEFVVIGAHYDHLGRGDIISGEAGVGEIHNGADDNASGVAALIEIAEWLASGEEPLPRTVVFVAFSAEEAGLVGSRYFVEHSPFPVDSVVAMLNLDTVGRMQESKLVVFGVGTATEMSSILDGVNLKVDEYLKMRKKVVEVSRRLYNRGFMAGSGGNVSVRLRKTDSEEIFITPSGLCKGKLKISDKEHDRCVVGIISGAGGVKPGLTMMQQNLLEGTHPVALTGRVYGL